MPLTYNIESKAEYRSLKYRKGRIIQFWVLYDMSELGEEKKNLINVH